jgi:WD40 repeat protein
MLHHKSIANAHASSIKGNIQDFLEYHRCVYDIPPLSAVRWITAEYLLSVSTDHRLHLWNTLNGNLIAVSLLEVADISNMDIYQLETYESWFDDYFVTLWCS